GLVKRENVHELGELLTGKASAKQTRSNIVYFKNNTGMAIQFAACGRLIYDKMIAEGNNKTIPAEWFAAEKYSLKKRTF
ncbi:MAG: hypothetical protein FJX29_11480, partial [Alphaproteobacteria bacterium]|nr:hypothetical protein [Alphaproteobacteria bacterium]